MFMRQAAITLSLVLSSTTVFVSTVSAVTTTAQVAQAPTEAEGAAQAASTVAAITQPPLRQQQTTPVLPPTLATLQQKHKLELAEQNKRLSILEQANQEALAKNQELQINNDSLAGQIQVLQSERSAQMFLYGAVTFGLGIFFGIVLYSVLYTSRRRF